MGKPKHLNGLVSKSQTSDWVYFLIHKMRGLVCVLSEVLPSSSHFKVLGTESKADLLFLNAPCLDQNFSPFLFSVYTWLSSSFLLCSLSSLIPLDPTCFLAPLSPLYFLLFFCRDPRLHPGSPVFHFHVCLLLFASWLLTEATLLGSSKGPLGSPIICSSHRSTPFSKVKGSGIQWLR